MSEHPFGRSRTGAPVADQANIGVRLDRDDFRSDCAGVDVRNFSQFPVGPKYFTYSLMVVTHFGSHFDPGRKSSSISLARPGYRKSLQPEVLGKRGADLDIFGDGHILQCSLIDVGVRSPRLSFPRPPSAPRRVLRPQSHPVSARLHHRRLPAPRQESCLGDIGHHRLVERQKRIPEGPRSLAHVMPLFASIFETKAQSSEVAAEAGKCPKVAMRLLLVRPALPWKLPSATAVVFLDSLYRGVLQRILRRLKDF